MYETVSLAELEEMAELAERTPEAAPGVRAKHVFMMQRFLYKTTCGTAGCLLGTWTVYHPEDVDILVQSDDGIGLRFGISGGIVGFLFVMHRYSTAPLAITLSKSAAIARLRKYIAYVKRKRALWAEHEWWMNLSRRERRAMGMTPRGQGTVLV